MLVPDTSIWKGFRKLHEYLIKQGYEIGVLDRSMVSCAVDIIVYVNSKKYIEENEIRSYIKYFTRKGAKLIVELVPRSKSDVQVINKLLSSYGMELSWIKIYDPINNNGVPTNPIAKPNALPGLRNAKIVVEHAFHIRPFASTPLLKGQDTALAMNPDTGEVIPYPKGEDLVYATIRHGDDGNPWVIYFAGYVFRDTVLHNDNLQLLEHILALVEGREIRKI